jgi:hypothetical protein
VTPVPTRPDPFIHDDPGTVPDTVLGKAGLVALVLAVALVPFVLVLAALL